MALRPEQFRFKPGSIKTEITSDRLEALRKSTLANRPAPSGHVNAKIRQTPTGWTIEASPKGGGAASARAGALVVTKVDATKFRVTWGVIRGNSGPFVIPANVDLDGTVAESRWVYLSIAMGANLSVTSATVLATASTMPENVYDEATGEPITAYFFLGQIVFDAGAIVSIGNSNGTRGGSIIGISYIRDRVCVDDVSTDRFDVVFIRQ
jgi:hypothetical protein